MPVGFHRLELFQPLLDREFFFVVVIFGEEIAVFATEVTTVGDVDRADGKLRQAKDEQLGDVAKFGEFSTNVLNLCNPCNPWLN